MSNYVKTKDFAAADALATGTPAKAIKGTDLGLEFDNIATAVATKVDTAGLFAIVPTWTGVHTFSAQAVFNAAAKLQVNGGGLSSVIINQLLAGASSIAEWQLVGTQSAVIGSNGSANAIITGAATGDLSIRVPNTQAILFSVNGGAAAQFKIGTTVQAQDQAGNLQDVGWRDTPQRLVTSNATLQLSDRGGSVQMNTGGTQIAIPANASVAFPVSTTIALVNNTAGSLTITIGGTDNVFLAGTGTGGSGVSRTLAPNGVATIYKYNSTGWFISGAGVS